MTRLAALLRHRPAREARARVREALKSEFGGDPALRAALRHALEDHPEGGGTQLADLIERLRE